MSEVKFKPYEPVTDMDEIRSLVSIDACSEASSDDLFGVIQSSGCLVRGHFRLLSGNHSEYFLRYSQIRRSRRYHDVITNLLISQLQERSIEFDAILCPESAGQSIGVAIQHQLGEQDPLLIVAKVGDDKRPTDTIN